MDNLYEAWLSVKKNQGSGGIDGVSIEMFEKNVGMNLRELQRLLQQGRYEPTLFCDITLRRTTGSKDRSVFPPFEIAYANRRYAKS